MTPTAKFRIEKKATTKSGWRKLPDCQFSTEEAAENYGIKYHTDKHGARFFRVVEVQS